MVHISKKVIDLVGGKASTIPVIVQTTPEKLEEIAKVYMKVDNGLLNGMRLSRISYVRKIPTFSMFSTVLTPKEIDALSQDSNVVAIYYNGRNRILSSVPQMPTKVTQTYRLRELHNPYGDTFTTSVYTTKMIGVDTLNKLGYQGSGVKVAVIDTGLALRHLQMPTEGGFRLGHYSSVFPWGLLDTTGHGTWCTLLIAGRKTISTLMGLRSNLFPIGVTGIASKSSWMAIKGLDYIVGTGTDSDLISAFEIAYNQGVKVYSNSWGGTPQSDDPTDSPFYPVLEKVTQNGGIPVFAAGNSGPGCGTIASPGDLPQSLTVGAWDEINGNLATFSSRGPTSFNSVKPDVVMPGVNILNGITGWLSLLYQHLPSRFDALSGTSMATPHMAGFAVLMAEVYRKVLGKELATIEIKRMMCSWAKESGFTRSYMANNKCDRDRDQLVGDEGLPSECLEVKSNEIGWGMPTFNVLNWWLETEYSTSLQG